ncbi:hypothetical protein AKJ62_04320 [candidate division MSBL1 archaeon SCGC-AAA259D14]|uniref:Cation:proton antiporter n=1 Tax=candidate division MSBL1 archaeon SCGC-AAA259D14 TaxID=1698261 RepID=A0A133U3V4_9EURY|nr:hypothetical protein AKJ62_04320 [candidate division MSBL1 archaeon SCGC-AAA259D14]
MMKKFIATFLCMWLLWLGFAGVPGMAWVNTVQEIFVGGVVSVIVSTISYRFFTRNPGDMINPKRWAYLIAYIPAYTWAEIKAHLTVAYLVLNPGSMKPSIVELPTKLKSDVGLTALANSITMTPGTLTVEIREDESKLFVHWISAADRIDPGEVFENVGKPFEKFIKGGIG